jgi:hypothetical protein
MKLMAVLALACGFSAAPMLAVGTASGSPSCDGPDCVPYVTRDTVQGTHCDLRTRFPFGIDSSGRTLICATGGGGTWVKTRPLTGVRTVGAPCFGSTGSAQSPDGLPLACNGHGWTASFHDIYFSKTL